MVGKMVQGEEARSDWIWNIAHIYHLCFVMIARKYGWLKGG